MVHTTRAGRAHPMASASPDDSARFRRNPRPMGWLLESRVVNLSGRSGLRGRIGSNRNATQGSPWGERTVVDWDALRQAEFPVSTRWADFDHAAVEPLPRRGGGC